MVSRVRMCQTLPPDQAVISPRGIYVVWLSAKPDAVPWLKPKGWRRSCVPSKCCFSPQLPLLARASRGA